MLKRRWLTLLYLTCLFINVGVLCAQDSASAKAEEALHIDIPTRLEKASVVIDMGHLVFGGDMPFALGDIRLLSNDFHDWNTKGQVVVVFHGDAGISC